MDVNGIFNDVYERTVTYYKKKSKTMIKSEVCKKDNKFREFWIERTVDNHFFTNIKVSVTENEIITHSLCGVIPEFRTCMMTFAWPTYSDERRQQLLSNGLERHEELLLEHYTFLYSDVRQKAVNSHKDVTKYDIMAFFASINVLSLAADRHTTTGLNSIYDVYLDTPKPVRMVITFTEEGKDLVITTSTGNVSKVPLGSRLYDVLYRILDCSESIDKAISNLFKGVAK